MGFGKGDLSSLYAHEWSASDRGRGASRSFVLTVAQAVVALATVCCKGQWWFGRDGVVARIVGMDQEREGRRFMFRRIVLAVAVAVAALVLSGAAASAPSFTLTPLLEPNGGSETAISISGSGFQAMTALSWLSPFGTHMWAGQFGATPVDQGVFDLNIAPGISGGEDADIDLGSTGTLHATSLIFINHGFRLGVDALTCPNADTSGAFSHCKLQVIDTTNADRQWITSDGPHVWISYHDPFQAALVHVQRSDDDGFTFHRVGEPVVGQGQTTGNSTFNNTNGPIVADPTSHIVYDVFAAGVAGLQKGTTANFNNIY